MKGRKIQEENYMEYISLIRFLNEYLGPYVSQHPIQPWQELVLHVAVLLKQLRFNTLDFFSGTHETRGHPKLNT